MWAVWEMSDVIWAHFPEETGPYLQTIQKRVDVWIQKEHAALCSFLKYFVSVFISIIVVLQSFRCGMYHKKSHELECSCVIKQQGRSHCTHVH